MTNETISDPVCGIRLAKATSNAERFRNRWFYFCSESCHKLFKTHPSLYIQAPGLGA
jgi:Cu+-exporting ATPase